METQPNFSTVGQIEPAVELMRSATMSAPPLSPTPSKTSVAEEGAIRRLIRPRMGVEIHQYSNGNRAYERFGNTFITPHEHPQIVRTLVREAHEHRWPHIHVKGSPSFASAVWEEAAERNIKTHGYRPTAAQRAQLAEKRRQHAQSRTASAEAPDNQMRRASILDRARTWAGNVVEKGREIANALSASRARHEVVYESHGMPHSHLRHIEDAAGQSHTDAARDYSIDTETVPEKAIRNYYYRKDGTPIYFHVHVNEHGAAEHSGVEAFRDHGLKLTTHTADPRTIDTLVQFAAARKWTAIHVKGIADFRREAWKAAALCGIEVRGYEPTAEEQADVTAAMERLRAAKGQRNSLSAQAADTAMPTPSNPSPVPAAATTAATAQSATAPHPATHDPAPAQPQVQRRQRTADDMRRILGEAMKLDRGKPEYLELLKREGVEAPEFEQWVNENADTLDAAAASLPAAASRPASSTACTAASQTNPDRESAKQAVVNEALGQAQPYRNMKVTASGPATMHLPLKTAAAGCEAA